MEGKKQETKDWKEKNDETNAEKRETINTRENKQRKNKHTIKKINIAGGTTDPGYSI